MIKEIRWRKRRRFAPLLSAFFPGLGQAFTGRWGPSITFFVLIASPFLLMKFIPRDLNKGHYIMFSFLVLTWITNIFDAYRGSAGPSAPCIEACPAHIHIPYYINLLLEKRYVECHELISRWTPLVATVGHVCHHPCEKQCTRNTFDEPVAICPLKAFIGTHMIDNNLLQNTPPAVISGKAPKVAIIGSGPAGLSAGFFMSRLGAETTIFESLPTAGGMLAVGIPSYRLPRRILKAELDFIKNQGVEIKTGVAVGTDISVSELFQQGYRAVFAAPGTHQESRLRIEGEDKNGVIPGLEFLRSANLGQADALKGDVVVVGGGNVAMDAARCALRLGASKVTVVYRRSRREMPANEWEVVEAEEEGVSFLFLTNPVRILGNSSMDGVECLEMKLGDADKSGRRRPIPIEDSEFKISCRYLIPAIGLKPGTSFLENSGAQLNPNGLIRLKNKRMMTHRKGLFAGGDAVTGPASVIQACDQGRQVAISLCRFLSMKSNFRFRNTRIGRPNSEFATLPRISQSSRNPDERQKDFQLIHQVYGDKDSFSEGRRCLRCDLEM